MLRLSLVVAWSYITSCTQIHVQSAASRAAQFCLRHCGQPLWSAIVPVLHSPAAYSFIVNAADAVCTTSSSSCTPVLLSALHPPPPHCISTQQEGFTYPTAQAFSSFDAPYNYKAKYTIPLSWCHSYNELVPLDHTNAPIAQGGYVTALLDNAISQALNIASGAQ